MYIDIYNNSILLKCLVMMNVSLLDYDNRRDDLYTYTCCDPRISQLICLVLCAYLPTLFSFIN
jgi:hypothetical protein